jgi:hypothetical protein
MRTQTATEYLIITAVVIIISLIVVTALGGVTSVGRANDAVTLRLAALQPLSVSSWFSSDESTTFIFENKDTKPLRVDAIQIDCLVFLPGATLGTSGAKNTLKIPGRFDPSISGLRINYTDLQTNALYTIGTEKVPTTCTNIYRNVALFYRFDYDTSSLLLDTTVNANHSSNFNGIGYVPYGNGYAGLFNDNNSHGRVASHEMLKFRGQDFTYCAWVNPNSTSDDARIISKPWNGGGNYNYGLVRSPNGAVTCEFSITTAGTASTGASISLGQNWTHMCCMLSSSTIKIYVNGARNISSAHGVTDFTTIASGDGNITLAIGTLYPYGAGWSGAAGWTFGGQLDDIIIWNRSLSDTEIANLYRAGH